MKSIKAIAAGSLFIIIVILFMQLAYIFIAVGYNALAKNYLFLNDITGYFRYTVAIPVFLVNMFFGGYITAQIAQSQVIIHCLVVGFITAGGMTLMALESSDITFSGIAVLILALLATVAGGLYSTRGNATSRSVV